ncbi:MAG: solute symporter family protein [Hyphomicrobiaceae bacterium]
MSFTPRNRLVNPRLGTYFGIFSSAFVSLVVFVLVLEQLAVSDAILRTIMLTVPLMLYAAFGLASHTSEPIEYFASGRRVPAAYCGLGLALTAMGATGIVGAAGLLFNIGYDAVWIMSGGIMGFVVMAVLLAPFLRKFGAFTLPSYLGRRFDSRILRLISAGLLSVPMLLILIAEFRVGAMAAGWLIGLSPVILTVIMSSFLVVTFALGGVRSLTWTNVAMGIAVLIAIIIPLTIIAVLLGYLPIPQLSGGPVLRGVDYAEELQTFSSIPAGLFEFRIPAPGLQPVTKAFASAFVDIGPAAYLVMSLTVMTGIASAPWLLTRVATSPGVYEARKSLGWATFFFGLMMLTLATCAIFMRHYLMQVAGSPLEDAPGWMAILSQNSLAEITTPSTRVNVSNVSFDRDMILFSLPIAGGLPVVFGYLTAAGVLAASLAAAGATAVALSSQLTEDVVNGLSWEPSADNLRLGTSRFLLLAIVVVSGGFAAGLRFDPLKLLLWALVLTGSTAFPVLVASIWWKRINPFGATAGVATGFIVAMCVILANELGISGFSGVLASLIAIPAGAVAAVSVSLATPKPSKHLLEMVRDIRVPGGEILYDREVRILRLKRRKTV